MTTPKQIFSSFVHYLPYIVVIAWMLLMIVEAFKSCNPPPAVVGTSTGVVVIHDTTTRVVGETHIKYVKTAKIIYDTTYLPYAVADVGNTDTSLHAMSNLRFVAVNDTVIGKIAISDSFFFPERVFHTCVDRQPDSLQTINSAFVFRDSIIVEQRDPLWKQIITHAGAFAIGFFAGRNAK